MHPNGQLPAYEWNFSDVNPPVHAWAVWRVYKIADPKGKRDLLFLERAFQKLLLNFTWWVNRKDTEGRHVFGGGFLGLDNIGVFDRSQSLPGGGRLNQADGTAWMASFCQVMLVMALELALEKPAYEDIASKFFEHFVNICDAINSLGGTGLWDDEDGFYYDQLIINHEQPIPLRIRSLVGLLPMCAVTVLKQNTIDALPGFRKRMDWFLVNRPDLLKYITVRRVNGDKNPGRCLLAIPSEARLRKSLAYMLDPDEFLSDFGIRSLSKAHGEKPLRLRAPRPAPRSPLHSRRGHHRHVRRQLQLARPHLVPHQLPHHRGARTLLLFLRRLIQNRISHRLRKPSHPAGNRPRSLRPADLAASCRTTTATALVSATPTATPTSPDWQNLLLFHEYFHAETGEGLGASHQTGWTSLIVRLVRDRREKLRHSTSDTALASAGRPHGSTVL